MMNAMAAVRKNMSDGSFIKIKFRGDRVSLGASYRFENMYFLKRFNWLQGEMLSIKLHKKR
ncbi:hypothetical protein [Poseidonocella sedimentorum]|uniref:hypothetical protein n=1 Tax=Poseidonocella sedimentorum TaxID=871652 RepID=UPI0015A537CF|nr:hypothetical protein [Poseidonocella sedimentorum]